MPSRYLFPLLLASLLSAPCHAQQQAKAAQPRTLDDMPCPPMPVVSPERMAGIVEPQPHIAPQPPASEEDRRNFMGWLKVDPEGVCRYREENRALPAATDHRVVFIGDSITEAWKPAVPGLFVGDVLDRGVSGQTTTQMLARFRIDILDLHPAVIHIMAGINDIHNPAGTALTRANIQSMVELAQAHGITVIVATVTPSSFFQNAPDKVPGPHIVWLNQWLKAYAREKGLIFADYYTPLVDRQLGIRDGLSNDGLHPNRRGFEAITPVARAAVAQALRRHAGRTRRRAR